MFKSISISDSEWVRDSSVFEFEKNRRAFLGNTIFFPFFLHLRFNLHLFGTNQSPVIAALLIGGKGLVKCLLFLTTWAFPVNEKDSCLKHFLLYLVACNYVSTPVFTVFTTSRLLSGCSVVLWMHLPCCFLCMKNFLKDLKWIRIWICHLKIRLFSCSHQYLVVIGIWYIVIVT